MRPAADGHSARVLVHRSEHGSVTDKQLPREFFDSAEYRRIVDLGKTLNGLIGPGGSISRGDEKQEVSTFKAAIRWLFEQADEAFGKRSRAELETDRDTTQIAILRAIAQARGT